MLEEYGRLAGVGNSEKSVHIPVTSGNFMGFVALSILRADVLELLGEVPVMR